MTLSSRRTSEFDQGGNAQVREVKAKLVRDYIENQAHAPNPVKVASGAANVLHGGALIFSASDDLKLYGGEALAKEFDTRQFDPYELYKQRVLNEVTAQVPQVRPRSLHLSLTESA
jgi:hypothetical protein